MVTPSAPLTDCIIYLTLREFAIKPAGEGGKDGVSSLRDDKSVGHKERKQPT